MKIPAKSFATSMIGAHPNSLASRSFPGVKYRESSPITMIPASRTRFW